MGRNLISAASVAAIFWLSTAPVIADEVTCSEDEVLITLSEEELASAMPCTSLGAYFIVGLGIDNEHYLSFPLMPRDSEIQYPYYAPTRIYMAHREEGEDGAFFDHFTALLGAVAFHIRTEDAADDIRSNVYSTFMIGEYWNEVSPTTDLAVGSLAEGMLHLMRDIGLDDYFQVTCFVRFDIPSLDVETILSSQNFTSCVESGGPNQ